MGLRDGRYSFAELSARMGSPSEACDIEKTQYLKSLDTIIIDEISMVSAKILDQVEVVLRVVKDSNVLFGGTQMILLGDFKQLKPIPKIEYGDPGKYVFQSESFRAFGHIIQLDEIFRYNTG